MTESSECDSPTVLGAETEFGLLLSQRSSVERDIVQQLWVYEFHFLVPEVVVLLLLLPDDRKTAVSTSKPEIFSLVNH